MSVKPSITGDEPRFERYCTERELTKKSGFHARSLRIARERLTEGEDWEHPNGKAVYWSKLGVDRLIRGAALEGGLCSARNMAAVVAETEAEQAARDAAELEAAVSPVVSHFTSQDPLSAVLPLPEDKDAPLALPLQQERPSQELVTLPVEAPRDSGRDITCWEGMPATKPLEVRMASVVELCKNPHLMLVRVDGQAELVKVRIKRGSMWVVGDRLHVMGQPGHEVLSYTGRAPRWRGEFCPRDSS